MSDELKPVSCGCGGEAEIIKHTYYELSPTYGVTCRKCGTATNQGFDTKTEAVEAWNRAMSGHIKWSMLAEVRPEGIYCKGCGYRMDADE